MRTSVRFEEKFQMIVWRHNQSFTNQLGAVYARASSMFDSFILEFYFCCYLSFIYLRIQLSIIWYKRSWFWFLSLYTTHAFHVNDIYL